MPVDAPVIRIVLFEWSVLTTGSRWALALTGGFPAALFAYATRTATGIDRRRWLDEEVA